MGAQLRVVRRRIDRSSRRRRSPDDGAHRELAHREGAATRGGIAPVRDQLTEAMEDLARNSGSFSHPLLEERAEPRTAGVLVCTSDRGLAGATTANVIEEAEGVLASVRDRGLEPVLYVSGKKGVGYFRFGGPGPRRLAGAHRSAGLRRRAGDRPRLIDDFAAGRSTSCTAVHRLPLRVHAARDRQAVPIRARGSLAPARRPCMPSTCSRPARACPRSPCRST